MEAIILAAGRGSRLGATTDEQPKSMVELGGKPLFTRTVERIRHAGIDKITVVTGYQSERLPTEGLNVVRNNQWASTGIAYSMLQAAHVRDSVIICYSDIVFELRALQALVDDETHRGVSIAVNTDWLRLWKLRMGDVLSDAESLLMTPEREITEIGQAASSVDEIQGQFMGLIRVDQGVLRSFFDLYRQALRDELVDGKPAPEWDMTTLLTHWLRSGQRLGGVPIHGGWLEVDTTTDLELYTRMHHSGELADLCRLD